MFLFSETKMTNTSHSTEEARLVERLRDSDQDALRCLFDRYQPILFRYVLQSLHDVDTAHDVVQDTFVRVWNHRASLQPHLPFLALLFRIGRNLVLDHVKHREVRQRHEENIPENLNPSVENPEHALRAQMLEERLREVIRTKLPEKCREVVLLSRMEGLSNAEIGQHLGISVKTVENQITRGLKILRRQLRQHLR
jgi:RNA polymerase sigma-70 factor (family 1)